MLVVGATRHVADRLGDAVRRAGIDDMRPSYGFVVRALSEQPLGLTELAQRLAVTKQAAIKIVDEMESRGFLVRQAHATDRRAKVLALTDKGLAVRTAALAESRKMEAELARDVGRADVDALRRTLIRFIKSHGGGDDIAGGRARPVW